MALKRNAKKCSVPVGNSRVQSRRVTFAVGLGGVLLTTTRSYWNNDAKSHELMNCNINHTNYDENMLSDSHFRNWGWGGGRWECRDEDWRLQRSLVKTAGQVRRTRQKWPQIFLIRRPATPNKTWSMVLWNLGRWCCEICAAVPQGRRTADLKIEPMALKRRQENNDCKSWSFPVQ